MKKYLGAGFLIFSIILLSGCNHKPANDSEVAKDDAPIIYFYGTECPHCQNVKKYFEENKTRKKVTFSEREVYHNTANANLMFEKAAACGITDKSDLGVPFLWAEGKCLFGEKDIVGFFNGKINEQ